MTMTRLMTLMLMLSGCAMIVAALAIGLVFLP